MDVGGFLVHCLYGVADGGGVCIEVVEFRLVINELDYD